MKPKLIQFIGLTSKMCKRGGFHRYWCCYDVCCDLNEINTCKDTIASQFDSNGCWAQCKKTSRTSWHGISKFPDLAMGAGSKIFSSVDSVKDWEKSKDEITSVGLFASQDNVLNKQLLWVLQRLVSCSIFFNEQRIVDKQTEHNISIAYGTNCFCCNNKKNEGVRGKIQMTGVVFQSRSFYLVQFFGSWMRIVTSRTILRSRK